MRKSGGLCDHQHGDLKLQEVEISRQLKWVDLLNYSFNFRTLSAFTSNSEHALLLEHKFVAPWLLVFELLPAGITFAGSKINMNF